MKNYVSRSDPTAFIFNPIECSHALLFGSEHIIFVGKWLQVPFFSHPFQSGVYKEALKKDMGGQFK